MTMQNCPTAYNVCGWRAAQVDDCTLAPLNAAGVDFYWATSRIKEWNATKEFREGEVLSETNGCSTSPCVEIREEDCPLRWNGTALYCGTGDFEFMHWIQSQAGSLLTSGGNTVGAQENLDCNTHYFWVEVFEKLDYGVGCTPLLPKYRRHIWPRVTFKIEQYNMVKGIRNLALTWRAEKSNAPAAGYTGPWGDIPAAFNIFDPTGGKEWLHAAFDQDLTNLAATNACGLVTF